MTLDPNTIQNLMFFFGGVVVTALVGVRENHLVQVQLDALADVTSDLLVHFQKQKQINHHLMIKNKELQLKLLEPR